RERVRHSARILRSWQADDWREDDAMRRVVDAVGVLGRQIVVVLGRILPRRVDVALAPLIVLRNAVGVAEPAAPEALARPLFQLERRCMVLALRAGGRLVHVDIAKLRERTQQLTALNRRRRAQLARRRDAEER